VFIDVLNLFWIVEGFYGLRTVVVGFVSDAFASVRRTHSKHVPGLDVRSMRDWTR